MCTLFMSLIKVNTHVLKKNVASLIYFQNQNILTQYVCSFTNFLFPLIQIVFIPVLHASATSTITDYSYPKPMSLKI